MRGHISKFFELSVILVLMAVVVGISGQIAQAQQAKPADPSTFVYDNIGQEQTLDPVWAFDTASFGPIEQFYEPLTFYKGGSTQDFVPVVASALPTISADGLTYTYPIRSGIIFHNGETLTPADVQYTFLRLLITDRDSGSGFLFVPYLLGPGSTRDASGKLQTDLIDLICGYNGKQQAVTVDGNNVVFHLVQPFAPFVQVLSGGQSVIVDRLFVISKGGWPGCTGTRDTDVANFTKYNNPPNQSNTELFEVENGSGPFTLQKEDKAQKITTMVANPHYWQGAPSFNTLIYKEISDFGPRLLDLQNGNADYIDLGAPSNLPSVYKTAGSHAVVSLPGLVVTSLFFNYNIQTPGGSNPLIGSGKLDGNGIPTNFFQDIHIRKAFNYVFDNKLFIQRALNGLGVSPATSNIQGLPYYNPEQQTINEAGGIANNGADLNKAAAELKQAFGGTTDKPGPVWTNGFVFTIRYNSGNLTRQIATNLLQAGIQALNDQKAFGKHGSFNLTVQNVPFAQILNQITDGTLPMFALGWAPDYTDPADYVPQWMGSNAVGSSFSGPGHIDALPEFNQGGTTPGGVSYKNWDDLLNKGGATADPKVRQDIYFTLQKLFVDNALDIMLTQAQQEFVMRSWVSGWRYNPADPGNTLPVLFNPAAGINYSKAADGNGKDDVATICASYPQAVFVNGGSTPAAVDCNGKTVSPIPGNQ
jgi:peptide/nickel transport system substrate-binding protein